MGLEDLLADIRKRNSTAHNRKFFVWINFSNGDGHFVKCPNYDCAEKLIRGKITAVTEGWEAFSCADGAYVDLPPGGSICRAWWGRLNYQDGPLGVDVTSICRELYSKHQHICAGSRDFGYHEPSKQKHLYVEFVRESHLAVIDESTSELVVDRPADADSVSMDHIGVSKYFQDKVGDSLDPLGLMILTFWLGHEYDGTSGSIQPEKWSLWFGKSDETDVMIKTWFKEHVDACSTDKFDHWVESPLGTIALLILMDQFSRNIYRNRAQAFSFDWKAVTVAQDALRKGHDKHLTEAEKVWLYVVLTHAEEKKTQELCVGLAEANLVEMDQVYRDVWINIYRKHLYVIERFGRFPHRNKVFARPSTDEELKFLDDPSCRFDLPATLEEDPETHKRRFVFERAVTMSIKTLQERISRPEAPSVFWPSDVNCLL